MEDTLSQIGAGGVPRIAILDQVDTIQDPLMMRFLEDRLPRSLRTSALTGEGLDALTEAVHDYVTRRHLEIVVEGDPGNGRLISALRDWGEVEETSYLEGRVVVRLRIAPRYVDSIRRMGGQIVAGAPEEEAPDDEDGGSR